MLIQAFRNILVVVKQTPYESYLQLKAQGKAPVLYSFYAEEFLLRHFSYKHIFIPTSRLPYDGNVSKIETLSISIVLTL